MCIHHPKNIQHEKKRRERSEEGRGHRGLVKRERKRGKKGRKDRPSFTPNSLKNNGQTWRHTLKFSYFEA
jgi:hypothetical protein